MKSKCSKDSELLDWETPHLMKFIKHCYPQNYCSTYKILMDGKKPEKVKIFQYIIIGKSRKFGKLTKWNTVTLSSLTGSLMNSITFQTSKNGNPKWTIFNVLKYFHHKKQKFITKVAIMTTIKESIMSLSDIISIYPILIPKVKAQKNNFSIMISLYHPLLLRISLQFQSLWDKFHTFYGIFMNRKIKLIS